MKLQHRKRPGKPRDLSIEPRRMDFAFDAGVPRYWFDNDPFLTHFLNAMSLLFPEGERFFVDAVRQFRDEVDDPDRQKEISGFIGQEAMHSLEHGSFNDFLERHGYPANQLQEALKRDLQYVRENESPIRQLAVTVALEHITAVMAELMLGHDDVRERMHRRVRPLWVWHAVEETEHKAVAWDLFHDVGGDYGMRVRAMIRASTTLMITTARYHYRFLARDGLAHRPGVWLRGLWRLWGRRGYLSRLAPAYLAYFRPDFHPWQVDNAELARRWKASLSATP